MTIDSFLTGKAAAAWPGAIVFVDDGRGHWILRLARPTPRDIVLHAPPRLPMSRARAFSQARRSLYALIENARAAAE